MKRGIVVAKYNEDISWLSQIDPGIKRYIYNKGQDDFPDNIRLSNIGREAHTYLVHIVNNYNNLDDFLIFTQGNPFDHVSNISEFNELGTVNGYRSFVRLFGNYIKGEIISFKHHPARRLRADVSNQWMQFSSKSEITPNFLHQKFFGSNVKDDTWVSVNAIFSIDKETILKHDKEVYIYLLELFDRQDQNWMAYVLEYFWTLLFKNEGFTTEFVGPNFV